MVKNTTGGSKHKGMARKNVNASGGSRLRTIGEEGEAYAVVKKLTGGCMCQVVGMDMVERDCVIRGKFRGKKKRDNTIRAGVLVLVGDREWSSAGVGSGGKKNPVCDLLEVYSDIEKDRLKTADPSVDWKFVNNALADSGMVCAASDDVVEFGDNAIDEEYQRQIAEESAAGAGGNIVLDFGHEEEVDVDDI